MEEKESTACAYCRTVRPITELKKATITFLNGKYGFDGKYEKFVDQKTQLYCADKTCAGDDQMAHEG